MSNPAPAFQHYARDWLVATTELSLQAQGAVMRLLCYQWSEGAFRDSPAAIQQILNVTEAASTRVWTEIAHWFPVLPDRPGYRANGDLENKRQEDAAYRERQRALGLKGARSRWPKR